MFIFKKEALIYLFDFPDFPTYTFIPTYMIINSFKIFLPTCLFQPTRLFGTPEYFVAFPAAPVTHSVKN